MSRASLYLLLAVLCWSALGAIAADWPSFRGPNGNGIAMESGLNKTWSSKAPSTLWKVSLSDNGYAGPAVAGGMVFLVDHAGDKDIVRAFDLQTGKDRWKYLYADAGNDNYGFNRCTPAVAGGKVYIVSRLGQVLCLEAKSGKKLWAVNMVSAFGGKKPQWDYSMSALVDGRKVIVVPGGPGAAVVALDANSGATLWKGGGSDSPGYATPVIATLGGVRQYVVFLGNSVVGVEQNSGRQLWSYPWKTSYEVNAAVPLIIGNSVFISSGYGRGCALLDISGSSARKRWENRSIQAHFSSGFVAGGFIFGTGDPGDLVCLDPKTGSVKWKQSGFEKGGIVGADGTIIGLNGSKGDLIMAQLTSVKYTELGRCTPLGGQSWTAPVLANGKLLVRNKSSLVCLNAK